MLTSMIVLSIVGAGFFLLAGYLWGVRKGVIVRDLLRVEMEQLEQEKRNEPELSPAFLDSFQAQIHDLLKPLSQQAQDARLLEEEMKEMLASLSAKSKSDEELKSTLQQVLVPMVEQERRNLALSDLPVDAPDEQRGLPVMLDTIAKKGGFSTVLLSDEAGLPLAMNTEAREADVHAGISSLWVDLVDRIAGHGQPRPYAMVLRDEDNQVIVRRMISIKEERYVLTAVSKGKSLHPDALDPTLTTIEQALTRRSWAS